jgi:peptide deformylase
MVQPLCYEPHPVLRAPARPIEQFSDDLRRLARDLIDTMYEHDGIGLAAPQIGRDVQVFVASPAQERGRELVVVNPSLEAHAGRAAVMEGCLSVPTIWAKVKRSARVAVRGRGVDGKPLHVKAEGLLAIVLQHEFDHLQGKLFIDRLSWLHRQRIRQRLSRRRACA